MMLKLMKHDFRYSAKTFFALGAVIMTISAIFTFATYTYYFQRILYAHLPERYHLSSLIADFSVWMLAVVAIITIFHITYFYRKSMFGRTGHLTLTMPISRGTLLASKLAVSFIWFSVYAILVTLGMTAVLFILWPALSFGPFFVEALIVWTHAAFIAFAAIALVFFCITLFHSVLTNMRLRGIISGAIGLVSAGLYIVAAGALYARFMVEHQRVFAEPINLPLVGLQYGRIVIHSRTIVDRGVWEHYVFIDIFLVAFTLAIAAIAIAATHYLLKKRISLQ